MSAKLRKTALAAMIGLTALVSTLYVRNAEALWPLDFQWSCITSSPTQVRCDFTVIYPGPSGYRYKWKFGDGSQTGRLASPTVAHYYAVSAGQEQNFDVTIIGYATPTSQFPDNIGGCTILVSNSYGPGGDPGTNGVCH